MSTRKSKSKHLDTRVSEEWIDWLDNQIKAHNLDLNKSELVIESVEQFFQRIDEKNLDIPEGIIARLDEFIESRSTKTTRSAIIAAAITDYLNRF